MTDTLPEMPPIEAPADTAPTAPKRGRGRPRGATDKAPRATTSRTRKSTTPNLEKRLGASLTTVATLVCVAHPADGMVVMQGVPALAASLAKLAEENAAVRANLERMLTAGAWSGVLAAVIPIALGIMANHGAIPANIAAMLGAPTTPPADGSVNAPS